MVLSGKSISGKEATVRNYRIVRPEEKRALQPWRRKNKDESCVQVAIYDDRLEVTSPGGLYNGLTLEEALQGHSKMRNRAIANVFSQIGLIEAWGTGLQRIQNLAKEYGLPDVEFIEMPETFRVNLYRMTLPMEDQQNIGETSAEHR